MGRIHIIFIIDWKNAAGAAMVGDHFTNGDAAMSAAANKQLVKQIYADAANRSGTTFADSLADDVCWVVTGQYSWSRTFRGKDAVLNGLMGHFRSLFAERPRTVAHHLIAEGDYVVVEARGDNITKTGVRYDNDYCMVWRLEQRQVRANRGNFYSALVEKPLAPFPASKTPAAV